MTEHKIPYTQAVIDELRKEAEELNNQTTRIRERVRVFLEDNHYHGLPDEVKNGLTDFSYMELINLAIDQGYSPENLLYFIVNKEQKMKII